MPVKKTQVSCPNCRQPVIIEVQQLFDLNTDPQAKQRLLSGRANLIQCPTCRYQGQYATPLVYHDPAKELLLTFVPPELGLPMDMQERVVGPFITQAVNALPQEKRKAYLLRPKTMLTFQTLLETILEGDGITKEMIQAQQQRLNLLQRLVDVTDAGALAEVARQEDKLIDEEFFAILNRLVESSLAQGDEKMARRLTQLQQSLLPLTTFGKAVQAQSQELEAAVTALQSLGNQLTREKLLALIVEAPTDARLQAYVSLIRQGMDYQFFQLLSERIDKARPEARLPLAELREKLLQWTREYDDQIAAELAATHKLLEALLAAENLEETLMENAAQIDERFAQVLQAELEKAHRTQDRARFEKLQSILTILQQLSAPPPEMAFLNDLVSAPDSNARKALLEARPSEITPEFMEALAAIKAQIEAQGEPELLEQVNQVYDEVLRFSMRMRMNG